MGGVVGDRRSAGRILRYFLQRSRHLFDRGGDRIDRRRHFFCRRSDAGNAVGHFLRGVADTVHVGGNLLGRRCHGTRLVGHFFGAAGQLRGNRGQRIGCLVKRFRVVGNGPNGKLQLLDEGIEVVAQFANLIGRVAFQTYGQVAFTLGNIA